MVEGWGHACALLAHPALEVGNERRDLLLPHGEALIGGQAVDGALGGEDRINPPHSLRGERRTGDLGQLEQLAPAMCPAGGLGVRAGLSPRRIEFVEPGIGIGLQDALVAGQVLLRLQEEALGELPPAIQRRLADLARALMANREPGGVSRVRLKAGATLVREWHGRYGYRRAAGRHHRDTRNSQQACQSRRSGWRWRSAIPCLPSNSDLAPFAAARFG